MSTNDIDLPALTGTLAQLPERHKEVIEAYGLACARVAVEAERRRVAKALSARYEEAEEKSRSDYDGHHSGMAYAYEIAEQLVKGELHD